MSAPAHGGPSPGVSVVLPVLDEEVYLRAAVERILEQEYPGPYEVVLAVGPSKDRTRQIADELAAGDERVVVVDNPSGRTPAALNAAVAAARYDVLVRVDGHSEIRPDYVRNAVRILTETGAANVGGMMVPVGTAPLQQAIARAMSSPLGIGSASFHTGGPAGPAPTVYLGVFRREPLERVGGFDETFIRAQDWELNHRLRSAGELVWFDPSLAVTYRPRGSWRALARQFFRTGRWRRQVIRRYPETVSMRYLAPPAAVVAVAIGAALGVIGVTIGPRWLAATAVLPLGYIVLVLIGSALISRGMAWSARLRLAPVIVVMHMTWGVGFLRGVRRPPAPQSGTADYPESARRSESGEDDAQQARGSR